MSIVWKTDTCGYLPGPANSGVVRLRGADVMLVDAGLDDDRARKILGALDAESLRPTVLFLTHAHADHMGGARLLVRRAGVRIACSPGEAAFARTPYLEPYALFGLAEPPPELRSKFLMAQPVSVDEEVAPGPWNPIGASGADTRVEVIDLAGHAPWQCGLAADGVCYCGDALFPTELWEKHRFVYQADVTKALESLGRLRRLGAHTVIPTHGEAHAPPDGLIDGNEQALLSLSRSVLETVERGAEHGGWGTEDLVAALAEAWSIDFAGLVDFSLAHATVNAHLTHLLREGAVTPRGRGGRLVWTAV